MSDDKITREEPDRSKISSSEDYEIAYVTKRYGLTRDQARKIIRDHNGNRDQVDAAANKLKRGSR